MKKSFFMFMLMCFNITCNAGKIVVLNDQISCLKEQDTINVSMDYSEAIFNPKVVKRDENGKELPTPIVKGQDFMDYLKMYRRSINWERESLEYFCEWFNEELISLTACVEKNDVEYEFVVKIQEVYKNGNIKALVLLKNKKTDKSIEMFEFKSSDGDANDKIALRDPMKDTGKNVGRTIKKLLNIR